MLSTVVPQNMMFSQASSSCDTRGLRQAFPAKGLFTGVNSPRDEFHLSVWVFVSWCLQDPKMKFVPSLDDFNPVFSTGIKFHPGMKNPCQHLTLFCPGLR